MSGGLFQLAGMVGAEPDDNTEDLLKKGVIKEEEALLLQGLLGQAPVDPGDNFREYMGSQGGAKGFFGSALNPLITRSLFNDDFKDYQDARSSYATDKALFDVRKAGATKYAQNSAGDLQLEELAALFPDNPVLQARIEAGQTNAGTFDPFTLSENTLAVSPLDGSVIAQGLDRDNRTAPQKNADALASAAGLDLTKDENDNFVHAADGEAYGQLLSAASRGTVTNFNEDGSQTHVNLISDAMANARQVAEQRRAASQAPATLTQQPPQTGTAGARTPAAATPPGATPAGLSAVQTAINNATAEEIAAAPASVRSADKILANLNRIGGRQLVTDENGNESYRFVANEDANDLYGPGDAFMPDALRSGRESDMLAEVEMLLGSLSIEERDKLKGSGTITDSEQAKLDSSISALSRGSKGEGFLSNVFGGFGQGKISDAKMNEHLNIIYDVMENARDRAAGLTPSNFQTEGASDYTQRKNFTGMSDEAFERELNSGRLKPGNVYKNPDGIEVRYEIVDGQPRFVEVKKQ